jgi:hypothetical protein
VSAGDALSCISVSSFAAQLGPPHHFGEKEKKKRKKEKERPLHVPYKPMTVVRQWWNKNPTFNSGRMSFIIRIIILCAMLELLQTVSSLLAVLPSGRHECIDSRYFIIGRAKAPFTSIQSPHFR